MPGRISQRTTIPACSPAYTETMAADPPKKPTWEYSPMPGVDHPMPMEEAEGDAFIERFFSEDEETAGVNSSPREDASS